MKNAQEYINQIEKRLNDYKDQIDSLTAENNLLKKRFVPTMKSNVQIAGANGPKGATSES